MKKGDFIVTEKGVAEVVDIDEDDKLECYFIVPAKANGKVYAYADEWEVVERSQVVTHKEKPVDKFDYPKMYMELGFRPLDGELFIKVDADVENDEDLKHFELPTDCIDIESEDEEEVFDFIVPDEEGEPFAPASPTSEFVQETHRAVRGYNTWVPNESNKMAVGTKRLIDRMEEKYARMEDDRQFAQGTSVDYAHPPLNTSKSTTN